MMKPLPDEIVHDREVPGLQPGDGLLGRPAAIVKTEARNQRDDERSARSPGIAKLIGQRGVRSFTSTRSQPSQVDGGGWRGPTTTERPVTLGSINNGRGTMRAV